ncbi:MAG: DsbA family protein [Candidatus Micrarchaeota archaeon]|nr:DsbA family protein [Candidatus Micrarchaeota archaeon]
MGAKLAAFLLLFLLLFGCASQPISQGTTPQGRAYRGSATPKVVIVEYSDFECPYCARAQAAVEEILRAYPAEVQLQFRHFPLEVHPKAYLAARAAACAEEQKKFWEMHDLLFANQRLLEEQDIRRYAAQIGLDEREFSACLSSFRPDALIQSDMREARQAGISATPSFKIGSSVIRGAQPALAFRSVVESELAKYR